MRRWRVFRRARAHTHRHRGAGIRVMVLNRLCDPDSKLGVLRWLETVALPGVDVTKITHQQLLRSMDALMDHQAERRCGGGRATASADRSGSVGGVLRSDHHPQRGADHALKGTCANWHG